MLTFTKKCDILKNKVIRVHILANSNSKKDQELKYKVKDFVSEKVYELLKNTKSKRQAQNIILSNLDYISKISKNSIKKNGYDYDVDVSLTKSYFPTRKYGDFTFPAGVYDALKVVIGDGRGKNWWCVAFPPMCSPIYNNQENNKEILGAEQLELIQHPCEYKFAVLELILRLKQALDLGS